MISVNERWLEMANLPDNPLPHQLRPHFKLDFFCGAAWAMRILSDLPNKPQASAELAAMTRELRDLNTPQPGAPLHTLWRLWLARRPDCNICRDARHCGQIEKHQDDHRRFFYAGFYSLYCDVCKLSDQSNRPATKEKSSSRLLELNREIRSFLIFSHVAPPNPPSFATN